MESWSELNPDQPLACRGVPRYAEVIEKGLGHWLRNPAQAAAGRVLAE
jgi:hypothetical protein